MADKRWHVVPGEDDRTDPEAAYWTVSLSPDEPGWETDMGYEGYGLTKALAEELANAANAAYNPRGLPKWARAISDHNAGMDTRYFGVSGHVVLDQEDDGA